MKRNIQGERKKKENNNDTFSLILFLPFEMTLSRMTDVYDEDNKIDSFMNKSNFFYYFFLVNYKTYNMHAILDRIRNALVLI